MKTLSDVYKNEIGFCFDCECDNGQGLDQELIIARGRCGINSNFVYWSRSNNWALVSGSDEILVENLREYLILHMGWNQQNFISAADGQLGFQEGR